MTNENRIRLIMGGVFLGIALTLLITNFPVMNQFYTKSANLPAPKSRIKESDIHVYANRIVIDVKDPQWTAYADTNSMLPTLDFSHNGLVYTNPPCDELIIGDIVGFPYNNQTISHRIVDTGFDDEGRYFVTKGDNNRVGDPGLRRCGDIVSVMFGLIY